MWQAHLAQYGRRSRGIRRRDDGAERDGGAPGHARLQGTRDDCDSRDREPDRDQDETAHGRPVVAKIAQAGVVGRIQQHRRHEQRQREPWVEPDVGHPRHQREPGARQGQQCGPGAPSRGASSDRLTPPSRRRRTSWKVAMTPGAAHVDAADGNVVPRLWTLSRPPQATPVDSCSSGNSRFLE